MFLPIPVSLLALPRREAISLQATRERHPVSFAIVVFAFLVSPLIVSLTPCGLRAQSWNSNLEGLITDPSSAVIPQAQVTLISNASGQVRHTQTDAQGFYTFPLLPVGVYDLTVAVSGFATRTVKSLSLQVGQSKG